MNLPSHRTNLASAQWADPVDFKERNRYDEDKGSIWLGRSPLEDTRPIGYTDNRHVCLIGGTRDGKGTSIILPNICSWPGSVVVIDPKGENATVAAARRGQGSEYCKGLNQDVHVLDPFKAVEGQDVYQSKFNPLDALDPARPDLIDHAGLIADSLVVVREDSKDPFWEESARYMVKILVLHIVTCEEYVGKRNLVTLRELIIRGDWEAVKNLKEVGHEDVPSAQMLLWQGVLNNDALEGMISGGGDTYLSMYENNSKGFDGVHSTAIVNTEFLDSPGMRDCVSSSNFKLSDLKTKTQGVSLFLSLPQRFMPTHFRWMRMMISLITAEMEIVRQQPATGYPVLMLLDEFAGLKRMRSIENAVAQIAGYGVKLFFVLQSLEQLKGTYKDHWETFLANAGIKIFFGVRDPFTRNYVSQMLGETEVFRDTSTSSETSGKNSSVGTSTSKSTSEGSSEGKTKGHGISNSEGESQSENHGSTASTQTGESRSKTTGTGRSVTKGSNFGLNRNSGRGSSEGRNDSNGYNWGYSYDAGKRGRSSGSSNSSGSSSGSSRNSSRGQSFGRSYSNSESWNESLAISKSSSQTFGLTHGSSFSRNSSHSRSENESLSEGKTQSISESSSQSKTSGTSRSTTSGINQTLHHRPLITGDEIGMCLSPLSDPLHPQYPGFALIVPSDGRPSVVRRCNYYEDGQFIGWFDAHPDFPENAPPKFLQQVEILGLPAPDQVERELDLIEAQDAYLYSNQSASVEWFTQPNQAIYYNDHVAKIGMIRFKQNIPHLLEAVGTVAHPEVEVMSDGSGFYLLLRSPQSGFMLMQKALNGMAVGKLMSDRRVEYNERDFELHTPLKYFADYLMAIAAEVKRRDAEEKRQIAEQIRLLAEQKRRDAEKAKKLANKAEAARLQVIKDKEAAERRAAEEAETQRLQRLTDEREKKEKVEQARLEAIRLEAEEARELIQQKRIVKASKIIGIPLLVVGLIAFLNHLSNEKRLAYQKPIIQLIEDADPCESKYMLKPYVSYGLSTYDKSVVDALPKRKHIGMWLGSDDQPFDQAVELNAHDNRVAMQYWLSSSIARQLKPMIRNPVVDAYQYQIRASENVLHEYYGLDGNWEFFLPYLVNAYSAGFMEGAENEQIRELFEANVPRVNSSLRGYQYSNIDYSMLTEKRFNEMVQGTIDSLGDQALGQWMETVVEYMRGRAPEVSLSNSFFGKTSIDLFLITQMAKEAPDRLDYGRENLSLAYNSLEYLGSYEALITGCHFILNTIPVLHSKYSDSIYDEYRVNLSLLSADIKEFLLQEEELSKAGYRIPDASEMIGAN